MTVSQQEAAFTIRRYEPTDEEAVLRLLRLSLGDGTSFVRNVDFWRWKHFESPFGASQLLLAAGTEVLGLRAFMRWVFRTPGGRVRAVRAVDTATHPDVRRMGIFSRLTLTSLDQAKADGVHLVFNTPNPQSMAGYLKMGWQLAGRPRLLMRPLNLPAIAAVKVFRRRSARPPALAGLFRQEPPPVADLLARPELDALLAEDDLLRREGIRTERTSAFLRWRYASASPRYFALAAGRDSLTAALIFRPNVRAGLREIMLSEVLATEGGGGAVRALVGGLAAAARADYIVAAAAPASAHWRMLRGAGFLPLPAGAGPNFTVFPLIWPEGAGVDPLRLADWRFSLGDLEIF